MVAAILLVLVFVDTLICGWLLSQLNAVKRTIEGLGNVLSDVAEAQAAQDEREV